MNWKTVTENKKGVLACVRPLFSPTHLRLAKPTFDVFIFYREYVKDSETRLKPARGVGCVFPLKVTWWRISISLLANSFTEMQEVLRSRRTMSVETG